MRTQPGTVPPLLALCLLSTEGLDPSPSTAQQPLSTEQLEAVRLDHHLVGGRLGRSLGLTVTWARTRWIPGSSRNEVLPSFRVTVAGRRPDRHARDLLTDSLGRRGWSGHVTADASRLRIEAQRENDSLLLLGDGSTITLTLSGSRIAVGSTAVLHLIAGVHEDDDLGSARGAPRRRAAPADPTVLARGRRPSLPGEGA